MQGSKRRVQVFIGSLVIILSLGYLVFGGLRDTMVYFVIPTELQARGARAVGKPVRLGGTVVPDTIEVHHQGNPPDLFAEGGRRGHRGPSEERWYLPGGDDFCQALGRISPASDGRI